ncbi:Cellulose synthase-like protein E6 [Camellia lanceoleosa]|uniref:Cellulose synthase-like protein E6 n=1 Tax=Camellia lanceoleosa TaxID=1840588 RepID=A0ACC0H3X3_9ERIC|nr:Cellulose synthase-like protein E6 [Camellia lanceoleosa]
MGLDWYVHGRALVRFLLDHHSLCSLECYLSLPFQAQAHNQVRGQITSCRHFRLHCGSQNRASDNDMKFRIEAATEKGSLSKEVRNQHKGFLEWNSQVTKHDHQSIVQILIDGRKPSAVDDDGHQLPTLVYLAREKRPQCPHNFKAGSMNALIRVSSEISNAPIILNLDCDMYSNDSDAIKEALCFFMDEKHGHKTSYVQHPQSYNNITKNDIYSNVASTTHLIELAGIDGYNAALYCGTGCFHRRESLCGLKYYENYRGELKNSVCDTKKDRTVHELEGGSKILANCSYEKGTQWGKETRKAFLGIAPTTLDQALVQHKRWSEGMFQIFLSKYCPFIYGHGKIKLGAQMGYCVYLLWAPSSFPTLYYVTIPSICLLRGVALFPEVSSLWFLPFAYVYLARNACSIAESLTCGGTLKAWCNSQRIWLIRRTTSYAFAFIDTILRQLGLSQTAFAITAKVVDEDLSKRYEQEMLEFGSSSVMFDIIATLAVLNLFSFVGGIVKFSLVRGLIPQIVLCWLVVVVNVPVYQALFIRNDKGRFPFSVVFKSIVFASLTCVMSVY